MTAGVTVKGADRLARTAADAADELTDLAGVNARVAAGIAAAAHPPILTGRLAGSITSSSSSSEAAVSSSVPYAGIVERRTGFLTDALEARTHATLELYAAAVNGAVAGVKGV